MQAPFQSALTTFVVQQILSGMDCGLPKYKEAARVHIGTLEALIAAAERNGHRFGRSCPIT